MPLSSPTNLDFHLPTQQLLHSLTHSRCHSVISRNDNRRCRPQDGALHAPFPAGRHAAPLRTPKYHERTHQTGSEAETWLAEEDEEQDWPKDLAEEEAEGPETCCVVRGSIYFRMGRILMITDD
jgi:hypothetical protein